MLPIEIEPEHQITDYSIIHSVESATGDLGMGTHDLWTLSCQVANVVNDYNSEHPNEMLRKTPETIYQQLELGNSILLASQTESGWQFLFHCSAYALLDPQQSARLDGWQVIEIGTAITHPGYRGKYGLGQLGLSHLLAMLETRYEEKSVVIATIKQFITGNMLRHVGAGAIRWDTHPYLAFLTDSCEGLTPTQTGIACPYRRTPENSSPARLTEATTIRGEHMPCTLITFDRQRARDFDDGLRNLHQNLYGIHIPVGTDDRFEPEAWQHMNTFFESLTQEGA